MKKTILAVSALTLLVATSAYAKPEWCGYVDHFHLDQNTPTNLQITRVSTDGNVNVQQIDNTRFNIADTNNCPGDGGYAYITYSVDPTHFCNLTIHDGPLMNDPNIAASCQGLSYNGVSYDGFMSYSYTLSFS